LRLRLDRERQETEARLQALQGRVNEILEEFQVNSAEQLMKWKVSAETLTNWERELAEYRTQMQEMETRLQDCRKGLSRYPQAPKALSEVQDRLRQTGSELKSRETSLGTMREERGKVLQRIQEMEQDLTELSQMEKAMEEARRVEGVFRILSLDLQKNNFPSYVLEHALETLAEDGSIQFDLLSSGRYAFAVSDREFYVVDNWNESKARPARTLSGGETFIASFALAMALAERIYQLGSRTGGSAALESLFIDEGFGTLDEEHLDAVVKALHNLQGTGRTIGIISHLPVLNNYLPARLVVHKSKEGSTVYREMAGSV
jgi:exonuclease SbcC